MTESAPQRPPNPGVPPGETPPGEASATGEAGHPEPPELRRAWGPWPLAIIVAFSVVMAALFAVMAVVVIID